MSTALTQVELHFSCRKLRNRDLLSKSDPFLVLYSILQNGNLLEIGRTETIMDSLNPDFHSALLVDYFFDQIQNFLIVAYDRDAPSEKLTEQEYLGEIQFTLSSIIGSRGQKIFSLYGKDKKPIDANGKSYGSIKITAEEVSLCKDVVHFEFAASNLDNLEFFSKSDPFLEIFRQGSNPNSSWVKVWTSEVIKSNLNPTWKKNTLSIQALCNADYNRPLLIKCMDWERSGSHKYIGSLRTNLGQLSECKGNNGKLDFINEIKAKKKGKKYKNSGTLLVKSFNIKKVYGFIDYLRGGCQINLIVGIDFTASNGDPTNSSSLHFLNGPYMNQYQLAIHLAGSILEDYDYDKNFPVYGFGGLVNGTTNHCFPLTFDPTNPEVHRVNGIMEAYLRSFQFVKLHGPTHFAPLIHTAASLASNAISRAVQQYYVLLIITDGAIMDMDDTIHEIVQASSYGLSIVIVGVGNSDFSSMVVLDGDDAILKSPHSGVSASRDIVQFVHLNQYAQNPPMLAREILREIPSQLEQYMNSLDIPPKPPLNNESFESNSIHFGSVQSGGITVDGAVPTATTTQLKLPPTQLPIPPYCVPTQH